jgi:hypothetical protein
VHPAAVRLQLLALVEEVHTTAGRPALDLNYGTKFSVTPTRIGTSSS